MFRDTLKDVYACNVFNCDDTNLKDNFGNKRMRFRWSTKYKKCY